MRANQSLVTIATFASSFEASLAKGALAVIGIKAFVPDEERGTFSLNRGGGSPIGVGGPEGNSVLQVFESDRDRALAELRRIEVRAAEDPSQ